MAIKLADTLAPMADFPAALAEHIEFSDGKSLQEKYDLGELGGEGGGGHIELTQAEYDALTDEEKLNGAIYFITDATGGGGDDSSHIELTQAEYDALSDEEKDSDTIYFITDAEGNSSEVELTEYSYIIVEPAGSNSVYYSYEDLATKIGSYVPVTTYNRKYGEWVVNIYVVRQNDEGDIEIINESGYETIIAPIGTGTVATLPFIKDTRASSQTTWSSKQIASALLGDDQLNEYSNNSVQNWVLAGKFKEIESKLDGESGAVIYSSLAELGLTADATIEDVVNALKNGESFLAPVNTFTNYETIFPNRIPSDQWNKIHIIKGASLPNSHIRCFSQSGACEYLANVNNTNVVSWNDVSGTYIDISDSTIEKLGTEILKYPVGKYRINSTATGNKFTDLPSNEMKSGLIEINGTAVGKSPFTDAWVYRMYKFETLTGSLIYTRRLNSGATAGQIELDTGWCLKQNIYTSLKELGLDTTATLNDIVDAMKDGSQFTYKTDVFDYAKEYNNIQYGTVTIHKQSTGRVQALMIDKNTGNLYVGRMDNTNKFVGWSSETFHRVVAQGTAGYFKFKPTNDGGFDQALRISVTDNYGGMINISGAKPSSSQYKPFKCIRLSYGEYSNYDAIKVANNKMLKLFYYDGYFYLKVTTYTTCTFTGLIEAPTYVETFEEKDAEEIPIRSVFDTPYNDGYADPSIIAIGDADSADGVIKTLTTLGFTGDVMTWDTGEYRVSHVSGLTNLPSEITEEKPGLRIAHYDMKKWGSNHNPYVSTYGIRQSVLHYKGDIYVRYTESGATAGALITDTGWKKIQIGNTKITLAFNSKTFKIDITKGREAWNGNIKFGYCVDNSYGEIIISSLGATKVTWSCSEGIRYVKSVTYTIDPDNKAHVTIGVELYDIVYGVHQLETSGDFATINSFTGDAFTGTSVAERQGIRGRNNGVGILCEVADLGLTTPCTTVQIAQAMRNLSNYIGRIPTSGMIGIFDNGGNKITDAPSEYGLLQVNVYGYDRIMIRYDGIGSSSHTGSWIGKVKGSGGTFSEVTWERVDDNFNGKEVKSITIDLSASDLQSTGSGSVHLSLGNYIDKSTKAIRAEGYYNPPSDSTYPVVIPVVFGSQAGHLTTDSTGYSFRVVQSPSGKKGSGFVKIYYID